MRIEAEGFVLRPWRRGDEAALVCHADSRRVWRNLTDRFPHPYRPSDALAWIALHEAHEGPPHDLALEVEGEAVGGVGLKPGEDLARRSAEVGYWLGEAYWGRGLATAALGELTRYAFREFDFERLWAQVLDWNPASRRVLVKCSYRLEGRLRGAVTKDGELIDAFLYARLRSDPPPSRASSASSPSGSQATQAP